MKTLLLPILFLALASFNVKGDDPKITKDDNTIFVDGKAYFKFKWEKGTNSMIVDKVNGEKLFYLRREEYTDQSQITSGNPKGIVLYYSLIREGSSEVSCEIKAITAKYLAKILLEYDILDENGNVKEENFKRMSNNFGKTISQNRPVNINIR